nr:MAG: hypothetical protein [Microvirus sp.]
MKHFRLIFRITVQLLFNLKKSTMKEKLKKWLHWIATTLLIIQQIIEKL